MRERKKKEKERMKEKKEKKIFFKNNRPILEDQ